MWRLIAEKRGVNFMRRLPSWKPPVSRYLYDIQASEAMKLNNYIYFPYLKAKQFPIF